MNEQQAPAASPTTAHAGDSAQASDGMPPRADDVPAWAVKLLESNAATQQAMAHVASLLSISIHATQQLMSALIASEEPQQASTKTPTVANTIDWEGKTLDPEGQYAYVAGKGLVRVD